MIYGNLSGSVPVVHPGSPSPPPPHLVKSRVYSAIPAATPTKSILLLNTVLKINQSSLCSFRQLFFCLWLMGVNITLLYWSPGGRESTPELLTFPREILSTFRDSNDKDNLLFAILITRRVVWASLNVGIIPHGELTFPIPPSDVESTSTIYSTLPFCVVFL